MAEEKKGKKKTNELEWILLSLAVLVIVFVVFYIVFKNFGGIEYEGLKFTKERLGEIIVYHYKYTLDKPDGSLMVNHVYFRGNPEENEALVSGGEIVYPTSRMIYLGLGDNLDNCSNNVLALGGIAQFLGSNFFDMEVGLANKTLADESNQTYIDCSEHPRNVVIILKEGEENKVSIDGLCYTLEAKDCEVLKVAEKFILQSLVDAKKRSEE